jgi:hypothetical protein
MMRCFRTALTKLRDGAFPSLSWPGRGALQIPPLRFASVGMTNLRVAAAIGIC